MSSGTKKPFGECLPVAVNVIEYLKPGCVRIDVAGSIRRHKSLIGDIEVVAIPMWINGRNVMFELLAKAVEKQRLMPLKGFKPEAKFMQFATRHGLVLDLFVCDKDTWGFNYTLRTGSATFSHGLLIHANKLGITSKNARLVNSRTGQTYDTPEERDVFRVLGVQWVDPKDRHGPENVLPERR